MAHVSPLPHTPPRVSTLLFPTLTYRLILTHQGSLEHLSRTKRTRSASSQRASKASGISAALLNVRPFEDRLEEWITDTGFLKDNDLQRTTRTFFFSILRTDTTRLAYFKAIKRFFAQALTPETATPKDIDTGTIQDHIDTIGGDRPKNPARDSHLSTRALALSALRSYFGYLHRRRLIDENPAAEASLVFPAVVEGSTPALKPKEVMRILSSIETGTPQGRRDRALIAFLAFTACRIGAALKMTHSAIREDGTLLLNEKGARQHPMPIPPNLPAYLDAYLADIIHPEPHEPLFRRYDSSKRRFTADGLPYLEAYLIVRHRAAAAGIDRKVHPHCFRATAITQLIKAGLPLHAVKAYANHKRLDTTLLYNREPDVTQSDVEAMARIFTLAKHK